MAIIQTPLGWYNPAKGTLTTYDPASGQLISKSVKSNLYSPSDPNFIQALQSGTVDVNQAFNAGGMGGRSNVNLMSPVKRAADALMKKYPQMPWESALKYANQWVNDRVSAGHDANEIEDMAKGVFRDDKTLGGEFEKGINEMVYQDDLSARDANATGASVGGGPDPRGSIQDELRAFAGRMMSVLPPDHPQVQRIAEIAAQAGDKYATRSGIGPGGITATGVAGQTNRAMVDLQTQREGIGASALAAAGNQQLSVDQLQTQLQQSNQQANVMQGSNIGGMIGTGAGLIGGIVASAYGAPQALPGLMQGGGAAGQAIGGIAANNGPAIQYGGSGSTPTSTYKGRTWGTS